MVKTLKTCTLQWTLPFERHILIRAVQLRNFVGVAGRLVYFILFSIEKWMYFCGVFYTRMSRHMFPSSEVFFVAL